MSFKAFRVEKDEQGFSRSIVSREESELPAGELLRSEIFLVEFQGWVVGDG